MRICATQTLPVPVRVYKHTFKITDLTSSSASYFLLSVIFQHSPVPSSFDRSPCVG